MTDTHDLVAERQVLALALTGRDDISRQFSNIPAGAWTSGVHDVVATVLRDRIARDIPIDPMVVAEDAASLTGTDHNAERVRAFVMDASLTAPTVDSFSYYAEIVMQKLHLRRLCETGVTITQLAERATTADELGDSVGHLRGLLDEMEAGYGLAAPAPPMSLQELLDLPAAEHDWLVPNLLERADRLIITGYEGTGKSYLLAQFALTIAAGIHPFRADVINRDGHRVLVIDCENSRDQIRRRYQKTVRIVNYLREQHAMPPIDWSQHLRFVLRPDGVDLTNLREAARIEQAIAATAPDLVVVGPLYRMHKMNINDEQAARELVDALDRLRVKYRFTLIAEAHVGHVGESQGGRKLRPTGSSLFLRWPEFGYGIRAFGDSIAEEHPSVVEFVAWRGARDERDWPRLLKHSSDLLPWMPANTDYWDRPAHLRAV